MQPFRLVCYNLATELDPTKQNVKGLREDIDRARERYKKAQNEFDHALSIARDTSFSSDGAKGLRIATKNYAQALKEYHEAVHKMAKFIG